MAKVKGQEAANRARSGRPNRKSGKSTPTSRKLKALKDTVTDPQTYIGAAIDAITLGGGAQVGGAAGRGAQIVASAARRGGVKNLGAYAKDAMAMNAARKAIKPEVMDDVLSVRYKGKVDRWNMHEVLPQKEINKVYKATDYLSGVYSRRPVIADRAEQIVQKEMAKISKNMAKRANHPSIRRK